MTANGAESPAVAATHHIAQARYANIQLTVARTESY
jgi:hypothetical protein